MRELLKVDNLQTYFFTEAGVVRALDGISISVKEGTIHGLVGESGSGKTVAALSIMRIVPRPGRIIGGKILFDGTDMLSLDNEEMRKFRGKKMGMIFQDPISSLDPLFTVGSQLTEVVRNNLRVSKQEANEEAIKLLQIVGIPEPEKRMNSFPHELSGGMKQRIAIARALISRPSLLFADEPTTNLDVTIQAQVLELIKDLQKRFNMTVVLITHDMGIIAETTQYVTVIYAGQVYEACETKELFLRPKHPYTESLLKAVPRLDKRKELVAIPGNVPNLIDPPTGCRFHPRCPYAIDICRTKVPVLEEAGPEHYVACHRWKELSLQVV
ncbi:MAG: ABC transporter ATP-binding protein [Conexivisphaerales archaeon]